MNQQINLYQPIFRQERKLLSLRTVCIALSMVVIALLAIWGFSWRRVSHLADDVATVRHRLEMQQAMVANVSGQIATQTSPEQVQTNIKRLSSLLAERSRALQLLRGGAAGSTAGFASRLEALARNRTDGLWLDRLSLSGGNDGSGLTFEGRALDAQLLPVYLQQLANEPDLSGARFDQVVIDRHATREAAEREAQSNASQMNSQVTAQAATKTGTSDEAQLSSTVRFSVASRRIRPGDNAARHDDTNGVSASRSAANNGASKEPRT